MKKAEVEVRSSESIGSLFNLSLSLNLPITRSSMPMYDYKCLDCGKESLVVLTLREHETRKVACPSCKSTNMKQLFTSFIAHTTKKS